MLAVIFRVLARLSYLQDWMALKDAAEFRLREIRKDPEFWKLDSLYLALVVAEDRRFFHHCGVDIRAILRAAVALVSGAGLQGGSTITQQLVRNLTSNYARSLKRKYKEVLLASLLDAEFQKYDLLKAYLKVAYFGWRMNGVHQALRRMEMRPPLGYTEAANIVARLKYPEPEVGSNVLMQKINSRAAHIERLMYQFEANTE